MSWITLLTVLIVWPLAGLGVAYLFGRVTHGGQFSGNAGELAPPVVSYLRGVMRVGTPSRAAIAAGKARREANGARRTR